MALAAESLIFASPYFSDRGIPGTQENAVLSMQSAQIRVL